MAEQIGINDLKVFPEYTRESYEAAVGQQAPPFDPSKPQKAWSDPAGAGTYNQLIGDGRSAAPTFATFSLNAADAKAVNLPGAYRYPAYELQPTVAQQTWGAGNRQPVPAKQLASKAAADEMAAAVGGVVSEFAAGPFWSIDYGTETRRIYEVRVGGGPANNVGLLLQGRYGSGIGTPGSWVVDAQGTISWTASIAVIVPIGESLKIVPVPVRLLADDEEFHSTPFGYVIQKKAVVATPPPGVPSDDLTEVLRLVKAIAEMLGIQ
jgi:hypothetical protein